MGGLRQPHSHAVVDLPRPAHDDSAIELSLPASAENVAVIRHVLGAFAESQRLDPELVEDVRLAVTEACTNVVRHAYSGEQPGTIDLAITPREEGLHVVVSDRGRGMGPSPDTKGPGLGLPLIAAIVDSLEIEQAPGAGSRVTMSFAHRRHEAAA